METAAAADVKFWLNFRFEMCRLNNNNNNNNN